jgi:hypothetical protein
MHFNAFDHFMFLLINPCGMLRTILEKVIVC